MKTLRKFVESAYPHLPVPIQETLVTLEGWRLRRIRYGGGFRERLKAVTSYAEERDGDELAAGQLASLKAFLAHAYTTSPHYKSAFDSRGIQPQDVSGISDLESFPVLEKDDLRSRGDLIRSDATRDTHLYWSQTSGSTGKPITVGFTLSDVRLRFAYLARMYTRFGVDPLARSARFSGRTLFPGADTNRRFWRLNRAVDQLLLSSYHLKPENLDVYVDKIARFAPTIIDGYPSAIYILARHINRSKQVGRILPQVVVTTAETLEEYKREEISQAFGGCAVINQYASSEGAPFITQDEFGDLVVNTDTGVFECVRPGTCEPAGPDEPGELLVTSFTTHAFPLIRYRIGDTILRSEDRLARSWAMPVVDQILGRQEDILYTPYRGYVGRLDPVFKKSPSTIVESQIVQTSPTSIVLKVVPDPTAGFELSQLEVVKAELWKRLGDVEIDVELHESLPRGANGKLRAVVGLEPQ